MNRCHERRLPDWCVPRALGGAATADCILGRSTCSLLGPQDWKPPQSLVPKAWDNPWRAPGLQSTLDSQRNWSLLSARDGGKARGGSRVDVITCKKRRQASKQWLFPGISLYPGHIWKTFLSLEKNPYTDLPRNTSLS